MGYGRLMSDVEHRVHVLDANSAFGEALEAELIQHEQQGWELAAALPSPDGQVSLVFERPRALLGSAGGGEIS